MKLACINLILKVQPKSFGSADSTSISPDIKFVNLFANSTLIVTRLRDEKQLPKCSKSCQKLARVDFLKNHLLFGLICNIIFHPELSKIAQSGRTHDLFVLQRFVANLVTLSALLIQRHLKNNFWLWQLSCWVGVWILDTYFVDGSQCDQLKVAKCV